MRLNDKIVLVTASTRGIGLACVKACAKEGAIVYMAARNLERAQEIADNLNAEGGNVKCVFNDATNPETFSSMVEDVVKDAGRVDVLVNNFGTSNPGKDLDFANTDPSVFLDTVNLIAVHEAKNKIRCNAVLPGMTATEAVETHLTEELRNMFFRHIPLGRMGLPKEIAAAVVYLASDEAAYTTGQILAVSGGFGLATPVYGDLSDKKLRR